LILVAATLAQTPIVATKIEVQYKTVTAVWTVGAYRKHTTHRKAVSYLSYNNDPDQYSRW